MTQPWFIAVAGPMGAGKTTLARGLASTLGFSYLMEAVPALQLLPDQFKDPKRWAFETQTAFLVNKAMQVTAVLQNASGLILDRTIFEDAEIFAQKFYDSGAIDTRSYATYRDLFEHFTHALPRPDLTIFCHCPYEVALRRLDRRDGTAKSYPQEHIAEVYERYQEWINQFDKTTVYALETDLTDVRQTGVIEEIASEVEDILLSSRFPGQTDLFSQPVKKLPSSVQHLTPVHIGEIETTRTRGSVVPIRNARRLRYPTAYIAGPFTGFTGEVAPSEMTLVPIEKSHGRLEPGPYRRFLLEIERALGTLGIHGFIPHRDINRWGVRELTPPQVVRGCLESVTESDMIVAALGSSNGSHFELGVAIGEKKPAIIIRSPELDDSFIAQGFDPTLENIHVVRLKRFKDIIVALRGRETRAFLSRYFSLREG